MGGRDCNKARVVCERKPGPQHPLMTNDNDVTNEK